MHEKFKEQHLFEIEIFRNIINVFTVTLDSFNASLMNKSINFFFKKISLTPKICIYLKFIWNWNILKHLLSLLINLMHRWWIKVLFFLFISLTPQFAFIWNLKLKYFVTLKLYFLSLLINLMHPCWIKVLISLKSHWSYTRKWCHKQKHSH